MSDVTGTEMVEGNGERIDVIRLDLVRAVDMFETPPVALGADHGTFVPGIELCITELKGKPTLLPVHLELTLPQSEISAGLDERLAVTTRRYCDERAYQNDCTIRSTRRSGVRALRIGLPITLLGLAITALAFNVGDSDDPQTAVVDILGWVLAWLGLWYPFDKLVFYPADHVRENRALRALRDARITLIPRPPDEPQATSLSPEAR